MMGSNTLQVQGENAGRIHNLQYRAPGFCLKAKIPSSAIWSQRPLAEEYIADEQKKSVEMKCYMEQRRAVLGMFEVVLECGVVA